MSDCDLEDLTHQIEYLKEMVKKYKFCKLTGFMKDQDFNEKFNRLFEEYEFTDSEFCLAIVDINYLHNVNKQGWAEGNKLIVSVADDLNHYFENYQVYRIGGDEFCVIIRCGVSTKESLIEKLEKIKNTTFCIDTSINYETASEMFKTIDQRLQIKKLAREDLEERL